MNKVSGNVIALRDRISPSNESPLLTVFCWTYNDVKFIGAAIESILMQETSFPVEIVIHNDASTDGTTEIVNNYAAKYPCLFRNIIHKENQWSRGLSIMRGLFEAPRGEFVALIHGDDCWTDMRKLQQQCNFLIGDPDCNLCGHQFNLVDAAGRSGGSPSALQKHKGTLEDVLLVNYVHTSTAVYRKASLAIDAGFVFPPAADWYLWTQLARNGSIGFINSPMSVYRVHEGGIASGKPIEMRIKDVHHSVAVIHESLGNRYRAIRRKSLTVFELQACATLLYRGRKWDTLKCLLLLLRATRRAPLFAVRCDGMKELLRIVRSRLRSARHNCSVSLVRTLTPVRRLGSVIKQFFKRRLGT